MGPLRVRFQRDGEREFFDVSTYNITKGRPFMVGLVEAEKYDGNYDRGVAGIRGVRDGNGKSRPGSFYLLECQGDGFEHCFLFQILPGENSRLMGVAPPVRDKFRLRSMVDDVAIGKGVKVKLLI